MFKAQFTYRTRMILHYDNAFDKEFDGTLEDAIALIESDCAEYGFVSCYATDFWKGKVLFEGLFEEE